MYSRNVRTSTDAQYAENIPPVYGGSRFYRAPPQHTVAVQYEVPIEKSAPPPVQAEEATPQKPAPPQAEEPAEAALASAPCEQISPPLPLPKPTSRILPSLTSFLEGDKEEFLLIAVLLLLCGEGERAADMIAILLLLILLR